MEWFRKWAGVIALAVALAAAPWVAPLRAQLSAVQTYGGVAIGTSSLLIGLSNVTQLNDLVAVPVRFFPAGVNPGASTLAITINSGGPLGPLPILKQSQAGLVPLVGNEFQAGQLVVVIYDGTDFECMTCGPVTPAGTEADFAGVNVPAGWLLESGQAISRAAFPVLFSAISNPSIAATTITSSAVVTVPNTNLFQVGWFVGGNNVTCNSQVQSIQDATHIVLNIAAGGGGSTTLSIGPYGQGDCATTFQVPNRTGRLTAMLDGSTNITSASCSPVGGIGGAGTLGTQCGGQTSTLLTANLPPITPAGTITNGAISIGGGTLGGTTAGATTGGSQSTPINASGINPSQAASTFTGSAGGGSSTPFSNLPPVSMTYKIIKT